MVDLDQLAPFDAIAVAISSINVWESGVQLADTVCKLPTVARTFQGLTQGWLAQTSPIAKLDHCATKYHPDLHTISSRVDHGHRHGDRS